MIEEKQDGKEVEVDEDEEDEWTWKCGRGKPSRPDYIISEIIEKAKSIYGKRRKTEAKPQKKTLDR